MRWPNQSCASLLSSSSIYYWAASNVCKPDTSGSQLKVPFAVTGHIFHFKLEVILPRYDTSPPIIFCIIPPLHLITNITRHYGSGCQKPCPTELYWEGERTISKNDTLSLWNWCHLHRFIMQKTCKTHILCPFKGGAHTPLCPPIIMPLIMPFWDI